MVFAGAERDEVDVECVIGYFPPPSYYGDCSTPIISWQPSHQKEAHQSSEKTVASQFTLDHGWISLQPARWDNVQSHQR